MSLPFSVRDTYGVCLGLYIPASMMVGLRLHERRKRGFRASDYVAIASWIVITLYVFSIVMFICLYQFRPLDLLFNQGLGKIPTSVYLVTATLSTPVTKISVVLLLLEVAQAKWHRGILYGFLALNSAAVALLSGLILFGCGGRFQKKFWQGFKEAAVHIKEKPEVCHMSNAVLSTYVVLNIITEVAIFVLSMPMIFYIKTTSQRLGLIFTFSLSIFTVISAVVGIIVCSRFAFHDLSRADVREFYLGVLFQLAEILTGLLFANVIPVQGKFRRFFSKHFEGIKARLPASMRPRADHRREDSDASDQTLTEWGNGDDEKLVGSGGGYHAKEVSGSSSAGVDLTCESDLYAYHVRPSIVSSPGPDGIDEEADREISETGYGRPHFPIVAPPM